MGDFHLPGSLQMWRVSGADFRTSLNCQLRAQILHTGEFYIVQTQLRGATWLRGAIINPVPDDLERLRELGVSKVEKIWNVF